MQDAGAGQSGYLWAKRLLTRVAILSLLALVYYLAGRLGLSLAFVNPSATAIWPPTGIAIAAFLVLGDQAAISILLGAFLVNFTTSDSLPASIAIALGNTAEGLLAARLVMRFAGGTQAFNRAMDVFKFVILAGLLSPLMSAVVGTSSLVWTGLAPAAEYWPIWLTWWLGDAGGALIVAPPLILWAENSKPRWTGSRALEFTLLFASLLLAAFMIFGNRSPFALRNYPLEFMFIPILIWAAYRFGQRETATIALILSAVATAGTLQGFGPFAQNPANESLVLLQSFMMTASITGLILAALVSERKQAESQLIDSNLKLSLSLDDQSDHNSKMILLNEMGDLLQSCTTVAEAYTIIGQLGGKLLPEETGILYIINNSKNNMEPTVSWNLPSTEQDTFTLEDCWALRRGRIHQFHRNGGGLELLCPHLKDRAPTSSMCIPMAAQGEAVGVFHIRTNLASSSQSEGGSPSITEAKQQIARAMADSTALALTNLKLRIFLREQSIRDPLTGLFNRRYLEETLEREFNRAIRLRRHVGVIMLDLDHFKKFNDTYGHETGDILLRKLGPFLIQHLRGGDIACRYGGEEFALILPEVPLESVQARAEKLLEGIKRIKVDHLGENSPAITLSMGIAMFPDNGSTSQQVLNAADSALYQAKNKGRDCIVVAHIDSEKRS